MKKERNTGEIAHQAALLLWPGYDLGTCIASACSGYEWTLGAVGVIPGGKFRSGPNSLDGKQFGRNLDEVQELGNRIGGSDAIIRARVPRSTVDALDQTPVDSFILRSGSVTAQPGSQLDLLNRTATQVDRVR